VRWQPQLAGSFGRSALAFHATFRALQNRNYRLFWVGQLVSQSGTWMQRMAQAWLVLQLTDSPFALGTITALQFIPFPLLSLVGGLAADRLSKRRLLVITQTVMAVQAVILSALVTSGQVQLWHIYVLAVVLGIANGFDNPARQSFVSEMVGPADLPNAVALNSSLMNTSRVVGPSLAGGLITLAGIGVCFWLNAISFIAVIGALLAMRESELYDLQPPSKAPLLRQLRDGIHFAIHNREVATVLILIGIVGGFGFNHNVFVPLLARYALGSEAVGFGFLFSCLGCGAVVAALLLASRRDASERTLRYGSLALALLLVLLGFSRSFVLTCVLMLAFGAANVVVSSTANTRVQLLAPPELRGRVVGLFFLVFVGLMPLGSLIIGTLTEQLGLQTAMSIAAALCAAGILASALYARRTPVEATEVVPATSESVQR
jgi:MFS family permease